MNIDVTKLVTADMKAAKAKAQLESQYVAVVQTQLDLIAKSYGYDNIKTAVTYADEPAVAKFQTDGKALRAWRSLVWNYCYEQLALVEAGSRTQPTIDEWVSELPVLAPIQYS